MKETSLKIDDSQLSVINIVRSTTDKRFGFSIETKEDELFFHLCNGVYQCGVKARENQRLIHRAFKEDGTILTETDLAVSEALVSEIKKLYPSCNVSTEESKEGDFDPEAPYTFILDPIDGTDAYSQGFPFWCVGLGILNKDRIPCGAIIYAPRFGIGTEDLFLCSKIDDNNIYLNGEVLETLVHYEVPRQVVVGANAHEIMKFDARNMKVRALGSSIIHMISPLVFSNIDSCVNNLCYVWDIASSHALLLKKGLTVMYCDGSPVVYNDSLLIKRETYKLPIIVGTKAQAQYLKDHITPL